MSDVPENTKTTPENPANTTPATSPVANFSAQIGKIAHQAAELGNQVAAQVPQVASVATQVAGKIASGVEQAKNLVWGGGEPKEPETNYVTMETETDRIRRKNLYYVSAFIGFVWMLFHFTVVFFFGIQLWSAILVGAFLGFGNMVSLVLDIPVGILQRYFYAKRLYLIAGIAMLGASLVFLKFIYASSVFSPDSGNAITTYLGIFLDSGVNIALLAGAAVLYGFAKEVNDITTLSYILNNADPSEYSNIISKNNIFAGAGSLFGLVASGFVLSLNPTVAVCVLIAFVIILIGFMLTYFDNSERTLDFSAITKLKVIGKIKNVDQVKEYAIGYLSKTDFVAAAKSAKFVFLKPMPEKAKFNLSEIVESTKKEAKLVWKVVAEAPFHFGMLWAASVVLAFGFWDTFATSFLIEHLVNLSSPQAAYLILAAIAIPAFVTQDFFIGMSKKIGVLPVVSFGLVLSAGSLIMMAFLPQVVPFLALGVANSLGYAAGMGVSQGVFLDTYNNFYAKKFNLSEIDSNASASPMKIIQNLANVVGLCVGGILVAIFGFSGFFVVFGALLLTGAAMGIKERKMIAGI